MTGRTCIVTILVVLANSVAAQGAVVYTPGPSFQVPVFDGSRTLDLDGDGAADYAFSSSGAIGTMDLSMSGSYWPFRIDAVGSNALLATDHALVQAFGSVIGPEPPAGAGWSAPGAGVLLTSQWSRRNRDGSMTEGWQGTLGSLGIGYLAAGFQTSGGWHYGWIRVHLPSSNPGPGGAVQLTPVVVDWAYETRPDTPLRAGVIEPDGKSTQFTVNFRDKAGLPAPPGTTGTFILTDGTLRAELILKGRFRPADVRGPAPVQAKAKPVASFGQPLIAREDHTAFFAEMAFSRSDVIHLSRGAYHVSIDNGAVVGRIVPAINAGKRNP
jgi:hypothetical protein